MINWLPARSQGRRTQVPPVGAGVRPSVRAEPGTRATVPTSEELMSRASRLPTLALVAITLFVAVAPAADANESFRATLRVNGIATRGATDREVPFSGTLRCRSDATSGTGMFEGRSKRACERLAKKPGVLRSLEEPDGRACAEVYGGPQTVTIRGRIDGRRFRVEIDRADACGIADWNQVQWLIGPPER